MEQNDIPANVYTSQVRSEIMEEQIARQLAEGKGRNCLADIVGQWPGDEPLDELLAQLAD